MKRSAQKLATIERRFSPLMRSFVVMLCALYVVAPLWHVCQMSGAHCEHEESSHATSSTRLTREVAIHEHSDAQHSHSSEAHLHVEICRDNDDDCDCPDHAAKPKTAQLSASVSPFGGTCLAMLLTTMPGKASASFGFVPLFSQRTLVANFPFVAAAIPALPQPPSRGPPLSV